MDANRLLILVCLLAGGASYALYLCHTLILDWAYRMGLPGWLAQKPGWLAQAALAKYREIFGKELEGAINFELDE